MKKSTILSGLPSNDKRIWNPECLETIREFLRDPSEPLLSLYFKNGDVLSGCLGFPRAASSCDGDIAYFARQQDRELFTAENFLDVVRCGTINDSPEVLQLKIFNDIYYPHLRKMKSDSILFLALFFLRIYKKKTRTLFFRYIIFRDFFQRLLNVCMTKKKGKKIAIQFPTWHIFFSQQK